MLVVAIGFAWSSVAVAEEPASPPAPPPTVQEEKATPADSGEVQERTVSLTQAVHFTDAKGQDVVVGPGSYRIEAEGTNRIRLLPAETGEAVVIDAVSFTHQQTVESPFLVTVSDPQKPDVLYLALLSPGGTGLEAIGTYSGVKPRALMDQMVFMTALNMAFVVQPTFVVIYEHQNFLGRSRPLGVCETRLFDFSDLNDSVSSIKVPAGLVAVLYEHADAGGGYGASVDLLEDRPYLSQVNFANKLSYIRVFENNRRGYFWSRNTVQNGQFVPGHWERASAGGIIPVNTVAVVSPPLPPNPPGVQTAPCVATAPVVRDHRRQPQPIVRDHRQRSTPPTGGTTKKVPIVGPIQ
jgi:hypothetical protein